MRHIYLVSLGITAFLLALGGGAVYWLMKDADNPAQREAHAKNVLAGKVKSPEKEEVTYSNDFFHKSPNEEREHYTFTLDNGLRVLLVSDPKTTKSAASLDLNVGSGNNPPEHLGIAHYLEHMLFLGTEKYPEPDGFQEFVANHGGTYNAYTAYGNTNYFFDSKNDAFEEGLDRFADFFIAPTFNEEFAERERNVVDSEFYTGLNDDGRRYYAVFQENLNPNHPMSRFTVGTKETLKGNAAELIAALREFYSYNYRAPLMALALYSNKNIGAMKRIAEKYFGAINHEERAVEEITEPLLTDLPALVQFKPVKEARYLDYYFPLPSQYENHASKPGSFVSYLLAEENPGSLEDQLRKRGWINSLHAGVAMSLPEQAAYNVHISLTPEGNKQVKEITSMLFGALEQVRSHSQEEWRYNEIAAVRRNGFKFRQQEPGLPYVRNLSRLMHILPRERWLSNSLWEDYNPAKINEILDALTPENMLMLWVSPDAVTDKTETYYKVPYSRRQLSGAELDSYVNSRQVQLEFPPQNKFISEDLTLLKQTTFRSLPIKLDSDRVNAWYKFNQSFKVPHVTVHISIDPAVDDSGPRAKVYNHLLTWLTNDKLGRKFYQSGLAGYSYSFGTTHYGLFLTVKGYNDKIEMWMDDVLRELNDPSFEEDDWNRIIDNYQRGLRNSAKQRPTQIVDRAFDEFTITDKLTIEQVQEILADATRQDVEDWGRQVLSRIKGKVFIYGNIERERTEGILEKYAVWDPEPLDDQLGVEKFIDMGLLGGDDGGGLSGDLSGDGDDDARLLTERPNQQGDSAVQLYYQAADYDYATRVKTSLLAQILKPQFFLKLRTEQELGYIVYVFYNRVHQRPGLSFVTQSNHNHSYDILARMDEFIAGVDEYLAEMSNEDFEQYKDGLLNSLKKPPENYDEELNFYRGQVAEGYYKFDDRTRAVAALEKVKKQDIVSHAAGLLRKQNSFAFLTDDKIKQSESGKPAGRFVDSPIKFKQEYQQIKDKL